MKSLVRSNSKIRYFPIHAFSGLTVYPYLIFDKVEYAIEAIKLGSTVIGIQTSEGVILAVEKRITSSLMIPSTIEKIVEIDKHIGIWPKLSSLIGCILC